MAKVRNLAEYDPLTRDWKQNAQALSEKPLNCTKEFDEIDLEFYLEGAGDA